MVRTISAANDLELDARGNLFIVDGVEAVRQAAIHRIQFFYGEHFLAPRQGVPHFARTLGQPFNVNDLSQFLAAELGKVDEVIRAIILSIKRDADTRGIEVESALDTIYGPVNLSFVLFQG